MAILKRILSLTIIVLFAFVLVFRLPWYIETYKVESILTSDSDYATCLANIEAFGNSWEDRLAWLIFARPIAAFASEPANQDAISTGLSLFNAMDNPMGEGIESVIRLSNAAVETENRLHVLADLEEVESATDRFLADPSKLGLKSLRSTYLEYIDDLEAAQVQLQNLRPMFIEAETIATSLEGKVEKWTSNPVAKRLFPENMVESVQGALNGISQAPAEIDALQKDLRYCSAAMNRVLLRIESTERIDALFYWSFAEASIRTSDVHLKNDPPMVTLLMLVFLRIMLQIGTEISDRSKAGQRDSEKIE